MVMILPKKFSKEHPDIYKNMRINQNRFSTHYEFHQTLKDIIQLNKVYNKYL